VKEVKGFVANTKEFSVFVQNSCVAKSIAQLNFHDSQCKVFGVSVLDGFHWCKSGHATACNEVNIGTIEAGRMLPHRISIDEKDQKGCLDGEVVHKFGQLGFGRVCKSSTGTGIAQALNVGIHPRPLITQMDIVEHTVGIEMSINGIWVKCNKDDFLKICWDKLKVGVWRSTSDWFPENQHIILDHNLRLAEGGPM
jgi:hypothetical protein